MADEIKVQGSIRVKKGTLDFVHDSKRRAFDMTGSAGPSPGNKTISTVAAQVTEMSGKKWCYIENLDDTNSVKWGHWDGAALYACGEISPGSFVGPFELDTTEDYGMEAQTADVEVLILAFDA